MSSNPVLCDNLEGWHELGGGKDIQEGGHICIPMADPCWYMAETERVLYYLSIKNKLIRKTRVLRVIPGILEAMGIATAVLSCKIQAQVLLPFGCHVEMLPNTQAFQGTLNPHSRKHNCLDHFVSSPLCFSSHEGIYLSFLWWADDYQVYKINSNSFLKNQ